MMNTPWNELPTGAFTPKAKQIFDLRYLGKVAGMQLQTFPKASRSASREIRERMTNLLRLKKVVQTESWLTVNVCITFESFSHNMKKACAGK